MEFSDFLLNIIPIWILELVAALSGIYYLKNVNATKSVKYFVVFLWVTFFAEVFGSYAGFAYFSDYGFLPFIEGTVFRRNYWFYNIYLLLSTLFLIWFFGIKIMNPKLRKVLIYSTVVFIAATTVDFFRSDFFNVTPRVLIIFGSLLILLSILLYYYSLLSSQEILNIRYNLRIYFSVAILVHTLCFSPLDFLSNYFNTTTGNELFVAFRAQVIFILNILLYLTYTIAFLVCSRKRN